MSTFDIGSPVWRQRAHLDNMRAFQWRKIATKRLELLMRWNEKRVNECEQCVFCGKFPTPIYDEIRIIDGQEWKPVIDYEDNHTGDCELAKELADE